jgi:hypothetical protein
MEAARSHRTEKRFFRIINALDLIRHSPDNAKDNNLRMPSGTARTMWGAADALPLPTQYTASPHQRLELPQSHGQHLKPFPMHEYDVAASS